MKKRILVIDDEAEVLAIIRLRLENAGYEVIAAANGAEGLLKARNESPDLIITDVLMPVMDGFAFYKEIKRSEFTASIPVLVLTSRGKMEDSFRVVGADDFVPKPFDHQVLLEKVAHLLGQDTPLIKAKTAKRVLVAGADDETVQDMVLRLKREGQDTHFVTKGPEVISQTVVYRPDIIVLDIQMDGMESPDIIRVLRQMPEGGDKPIIVYSYYRLSDLGSEDIRQKAMTVDTSQQACLRQGATEYVGRYNENTFIKQLTSYLQRP